MLFNSLDFAIFLPIVFFLYWFVFRKNLRGQNILIIIASYIFYGWWDWRFLSLIIISTLLDYIIGLKLGAEENSKKRKWLMFTSILVNLGFLGFFKYYNFFLENFVAAFSIFGTEIQPNSLHIILPVGISFYTFQTLSYTIDIYKGKMKPTRDIIAFAAFIGFFPQLVAGPIERATQLLPQFFQKRKFEYHKAVDGMRQILWGLFKKIVIADNCAEYANQIFNGSADYGGSTLLLGVLFFTFQIYGDFSGYSDIAIGTSRLFGFDLMKNFAFPYFSRDIAEFWRRWHISLSTWFRDYLYIPLGGSRGSTAIKIRNILIIFIVSGFWHGANWTFIVWGLLNAIYFLPLLLTKTNKNHTEIVAKGQYFPNLTDFLKITGTFALTMLAWVFFRAESISHALAYLGEIFSTSLFTTPSFTPVPLILLIIIFLVFEWLGREEEYAIAKFGIKWSRAFRWSLYFATIWAIFFWAGKEQEFIYFQF